MHLPLCLCAELPRIQIQTRIVLLTHVTELEKPTNTGRLLQLSLPDACEVVPCGGPDAGPLPNVQSLDRRSFLLFPSPDAPVLDAPLAHHDPRGLTLVVPDGTWSQAKWVVRRLQSDLPALQIPDGPPSRFLLRRARAHPDHLCTLEAVARALGIIEGHAVQAALTDLLEVMVRRTLFSRGLGPNPSPPERR